MILLLCTVEITQLTLLMALTLAPNVINISTIESKPFCAAKCNEVDCFYRI